VAVAAKETGDSGLAPSVVLAESVTVVVVPLLHGVVMAGAERSRTSGRPALRGEVYSVVDAAPLLIGVSTGLLAAKHAHSELARRRSTKTGLCCDIVSLGWADRWT
jgi:hypothetical protein